MKELILRLLKLFGRYLFFMGMLFMTGAFYYVLIKYGIESFYYPAWAIIGGVTLPSLCLIYYLYFIKKK